MLEDFNKLFQGIVVKIKTAEEVKTLILDLKEGKLEIMDNVFSVQIFDNLFKITKSMDKSEVYDNLYLELIIELIIVLEDKEITHLEYNDYHECLEFTFNGYTHTHEIAKKRNREEK